jgi:hypothetical protein
LPQPASSFSLALFERQCQAVGNGYKAQFDPIIVTQFQIKRSDREGSVIPCLRVCHSAAPQHVVHRNQSAGTQEFKRSFIIGIVIFLISVYENEIERCVFF